LRQIINEEGGLCEDLRRHAVYGLVVFRSEYLCRGRSLAMISPLELCLRSRDLSIGYG
jgi:hypothetical protein